MFDRRTKNVTIFKDSMEMMSENEQLQQAIKESVEKQTLYLEAENVEIPESNASKCRTLVSTGRSFETASRYARNGKKVCVLNFASATNPGGGVVHGSSAQEESLCRCSTLYPCLDIDKMWPGVIVFKSDLSFPERMEEKDWYQVDVLTCAAPNLRNAPSNFMNPCAGDEPADIAEDALYKLHLKRIEKLFRVAAANKAEVLILGAFGCGAFCNPPEIVAKAFREVQKKYESYFEVIEYAIFCAGYETKNYKAFSKAFGVEKE